MWIFLTAVFLVLFFLFYRHPKAMLKTTGVIVGAVVLIAGIYVWNITWQPTQVANTDQLEASLLAEQEQRRRQAERERQKQLALVQFEARRRAAIRSIQPISTKLECAFALYSCQSFRLTVTIRNDSREIVSDVSLGWVFLPPDEDCPSTIKTTRNEQIVLRPGETTVFNIDAWGRASFHSLALLRKGDRRITGQLAP